MKRIGAVAAVMFVGTVWLANWLITHVGTQQFPGGPHLISLGFGLTAPSGVLAVGLTFTLRDVVHRTLGRLAVVGCILAGCLLAYLVEANATIPGGHLAIAASSALAFLFSEAADMAVYGPLQENSFVGAVVASNIVGAVADSALFLFLATGALALIEGQVWGKLLMTAAAFPVVLLLRRRLVPVAA